MKTKLFLLSLVVVAVLSCSKTKVNTVTVTHDTTVTTIDTPFQNPVKAIIQQGILVDTIANINAPGTEIGTEFYTSDTGTVSQLGGLFETKNIAYTVTLWDVATTTALAQTSVTTTDTTKFAYAAISPIHLSANKLYIISYNSGAHGTLFPSLKVGGNLSFPYSIGNITFLKSYYINSAAFPTTEEDNFITPADFVFKVNN